MPPPKKKVRSIHIPKLFIHISRKQETTRGKISKSLISVFSSL